MGSVAENIPAKPDDKEPLTEISTKSLPDHDLHSSWGVTYSSGGTLYKHPRIHHLWEQYARNPSVVERQYHILLDEYTSLFSSFFRGYYPISMHAHASDALLPTTIASLLLNTVATSPLVLDSSDLAPDPSSNEEDTNIRKFSLDFLGWDETHILSPSFVVVEGIYGAGFGPLSHVSKEWEVRAIAAGPKPIVIRMQDATPESLDADLARAKRQGCIAVVFDIVSTDDGAILKPDQFRLLKSCCARHKLFLIIDETLTAIRCGAPFCFQRPEYSSAAGEDSQADLVIFGKGMGVSGIAIGFKGQMTQHLGFVKKEAILQTILYWRAMVSRPVATPILLGALAILHTAQAENWPGRSKQIGEAIREIVRSQERKDGLESQPMRGLGGIIVLNRDRSLRFRVMAAIRRRSPWVRWLPKLDWSTSDYTALETHVFGSQSYQHRQKLAEEAERFGTMPLWCLICGIQATSEDWCRRCFLGFCNNEACIAGFHKHVCV